MFLAIDSSEEHTKKIFGGVLLPDDNLANLERDFVRLRLKHKLFGEIKWEHITQYYDRYCEFIDLFFDDSKATFHSISFTRPSQKYNAAYVLIRTVTWKLQNAGINEPLYVLFDNEHGVGTRETAKIRRIAPLDFKFKQKLAFCNQGASHVLGTLQVCDVLTGVVAQRVNNTVASSNHMNVVRHVQNRSGANSHYIPGRMPKLYELKMHHFDPDQR